MAGNQRKRKVGFGKLEEWVWVWERARGKVGPKEWGEEQTVMPMYGLVLFVLELHFQTF